MSSAEKIAKKPRPVGAMLASAACGSLWLVYLGLEAADMTNNVSGVLHKAKTYDVAMEKAKKLEAENEKLAGNQVDPSMVQLPLKVAEKVVKQFPTSFSKLDVAATIIAMKGEAGNQSEEGKQAVAAVIINRVKMNMARTAMDAIVAPGQFEFAHSVPVLTGKSQDAILELAMRPEYASERLAFNRMVRGMRYVDPTGGATHFANLDIVRQRAAKGDSASKRAVAYFKGLWQVVTIGDHTFYTIGDHTFYKTRKG